MKIKENDIHGALSEYIPNYLSVHLSEDNRLLPGLGAIAFLTAVDHLDSIGLQGRVALEENNREDMLSDLEASLM